MELVLIVDDSNVDRFIAKSLVHSTNRVKSSSLQPSGFSALEYLTKSCENENIYLWPDMILLDVGMPVIDGYTFIQEYVKFCNERRKKTVLIILTIDGKSPEIQKYIDDGIVSMYIQKPFKHKHMQEIIKLYLDVRVQTPVDQT